MIYALLLVNVGNYVSGAAAISTVLKVNLPVAAFITAIVSTFYFAFGGMKGVAWVTMLHSALKYAGLLIILGFALSKTGGFSPMMEKMPDYYWTWDGNIGAGTIFARSSALSAPFCTQFVIQAISSTKDVPVSETLHLDRLLFLPAYRLCHRHYRRRGEIPASGNQQPVCPPGLSAGHEPVAGRSGDNVTCGIDFRQRKYRSPAIASLVVKDFTYHGATQRRTRIQSHTLASLIIGFLPLIFVLLVPEVLKLSFFTRAIPPLHYRGGGHRLLCPVLQKHSGRECRPDRRLCGDVRLVFTRRPVRHQ